MMLPGPSSASGGAVLFGVGSAWLALGFPRLLSPEGRPLGSVLVARFGLFVVPPLSVPIAGLWHVATPEALSAWFLVAWAAVWLMCVVLSAFLPCPSCGQPFGRRGWRLQVASSACPHCGVNPRSPST